MAEKVQDLYLPNSVITRLIKEAMPERFLIAKDAHPAISKAASSFIVYVTTIANEFCEKAKRKTISPADIIMALKEIDFGHFEKQINEFMDKYRAQKKTKITTTNEEDKYNEEAEELNIDEIETIEDLVDNEEIALNEEVEDVEEEETGEQPVESAHP